MELRGTSNLMRSILRSRQAMRRGAFTFALFFFAHSALLPRAAFARSEKIFGPITGPLAFPQNVQDPKLSVAFWNPPEGGSDPVEEVGMGSVTMTNREGQKFLCILPNISNPDDALSDKPLEGDKKLLPGGMFGEGGVATRKSAEELLEQLRGLPCFIRLEGWWTYKICFKKYIQQLHLEHDEEGGMKVTQEFFLGYYDEKASLEAQQKYAPTFAQKDAKRFHVHVYTNGTECDLTGVKRKTEVKYVCSEENQNFVSDKLEPATCEYEFEVSTSVICSHRDFRKVKQPVHFINCHAYPHATQAQGPEDEKEVSGEEGGGGRGGEEGPLESSSYDGEEQDENRASRSSEEIVEESGLNEEKEEEVREEGLETRETSTEEELLEIDPELEEIENELNQL